MSHYVNPVAKVLAASKRHRAEIVVATSCLQCKQAYTENGAWFDRHDFKCPTCGGDLDAAPFTKLAQQNARDALAALRAPKDTHSS